jgi:chromate reductase, NAD(P)H dehydrogenase (quinone)
VVTARCQVIGLSGSLRRGSYNTALLKAAAAAAPEGVYVDVHDLSEVPLFNEDVRLRGEPAGVRSLKAAVAVADAVLLATPEYNYSFSGVLKNALDWTSRPPAESPLRAKPVAIVGASGGSSGTVRAQDQLRQVLRGLGMRTLDRPEVRVAGAGKLFDASGTLLDEQIRSRLGGLLAALRDWALLLKRG